MVGIFSRLSGGRTAPRRTQSAVDLRDAVSANTEVTVVASHGIELVGEFKPIEHPAEPFDNDLPVQCPLPEPSILDDGRIWKERVSAGMRLRTELPVVKGSEKTPLQSENGEKKLRSVQSNRSIVPSFSAPEHNILNLLEEISASGI